MIQWNAAAYLRLSSDDGDKLESNSITNQRSLVDLFSLNNKDIKIKKYYIDDGYTGTTFDRPDFKKMIKDVETGKINTVIVKDLSRFGREYLQVGKYIQEIFPRYNIRFISINDNIDSYANPDSINSIIVPFKNLMNDEYSRDISNKVRSILDTKKKKGDFIGSFAPFGYIRDVRNVHRFIVDDNAALIVKKIFKMALDGKSKREIIENLNANKVPTPALYKSMFSGYKCNEDKCIWTNNKLDDILQNRTYIGILEQGKRKKISHKIHKQIDVLPENWICIPNHHKAIIKECDFNKVQSILYNREKRTNVNNEYDLFTGYLKCADCGNTLTKRKGKLKNYYYCTSYIKNKECSKHTCQEKKLEEIVLKAINNQIQLAIDLDNTIEKITQENSINYDYEILKNKIEELNTRRSKYVKLKESVIEDYAENILSESEYDELIEEYTNILKKIDKELKESNEKIKETNNNYAFNNEWLNEFGKNIELNILTNKAMNELIDNIFVKENGDIIIRFNYEDRFKEALEFVKNNVEEC